MTKPVLIAEYQGRLYRLKPILKEDEVSSDQDLQAPGSDHGSAGDITENAENPGSSWKRIAKLTDNNGAEFMAYYNAGKDQFNICNKNGDVVKRCYSDIQYQSLLDNFPKVDKSFGGEHVGRFLADEPY